MRHGKHRFSLGCTKEHREALMANLAAALFEHGRINTTLAKAKALRPFAEKLITLAVKAHKSPDATVKLHYRRLAIARVRDEAAVKELFDVKAVEFINRNGGYTRIYKLVPRVGDSAKMAIIELVYADDKGYSKSRKSRKSRKQEKQTESSKVDLEPVEKDQSSADKASADAAPKSKPKTERAKSSTKAPAKTKPSKKTGTKSGAKKDA